ncbi:rab guanine nucleotide exchange factor S2 [Elasticomyces elasticus]|nr:rab guanine nucleotide exchange factor S2 [Elasticomyces elasticus]
MTTATYTHAGPFRPPNPDAANTIPDPRTPSPISRTNSADGRQSFQHPDLSNEVAMLSTKLVNAINYQTNLDDTLQETRHQLVAARERIAQLEKEARHYEDVSQQETRIRREEADAAADHLRKEVAEERRQREASDKAKKQIEVELESLTTALFEEANTMVAAARKESEAMQRKNSQLLSQLNDTELLLASHQEQLQDLKSVMERMGSERDDMDNMTHASTTAPSTPGIDSINKTSRAFHALQLSPNTPGMSDVLPQPPLHFSHLISPALRTDLQSYLDFEDIFKVARASVPHSRNSSSNFNNPSFRNSNSSSSGLPHANLATSSPSLSGTYVNGASSPREAASSYPPLKDAKFFKRGLIEDIEPTLRLDLSPGLSWLARRTVLNSLTSGALVVEPFPPQSRFYGPVFACALCGESRRADPYIRRHRFRTSDADDGQKYPLCDYCTHRVRSTCDYVGFLRMLREGLWRADTEEERASAWEESVRLRERMFWTRIGGGVVPAMTMKAESPRPNAGVQRTMSEQTVDEGAEAPVRGTDSNLGGVEEVEHEDPFASAEDLSNRRLEKNQLVIRIDDAPSAGADAKFIPEAETSVSDEAAAQLQADLANADHRAHPQTGNTAGAAPTPQLELTRGGDRHASGMPGAFD